MNLITLAKYLRKRMMHLVREVLSPGKYIFKVYSLHGALMYHGSSESVAKKVMSQLKKEYERETVSRSNDGK